MHFALINIPANAVSVDMETSVTETPEARVQVLASTVGTNAWRLVALVDVHAAVVLAPPARAEDLVFL